MRRRGKRSPLGPNSLLVVLAVTAIAYVGIALFVRTQPLQNVGTLIVAASSPYLSVVALTALAASAASGRILLSIIAVMATVTSIAVQVPWYYGAHSADIGDYTEIRVLSSNLRKGRVDTSNFVRIAKNRADVVAVSELTPQAVRRFTEAGFDTVFPHSVLEPAPGAGGIGLYSKFPLSVPTVKLRNKVAVARLQIPDVRLNPLVASVHIISPVAGGEDVFHRWRNGIQELHADFTDFADLAGPGAVIVAGDFNSTPDMRQYRDLMSDGYLDAVEQSGAGFTPTFPVNTVFPPLIAIDHVVTRNAAASSLKTIDVRGSDHRAILVTVKIPLNPSNR